MTDPTRPLAERAARGDRQALAELLELHLPTLRAFVRMRAGPALRAREAESDIVQSVCREVLEHADGFRYAGESGFRRWLYMTTVRKVLHKDAHQHAERRDVRREQGLADGAEQLGELGHAYRFASPSQEAIGREELERMESALARLADDDREVILLSRIVGLSRTDIAAEMGRTEAAVKNLLHRALAKLADELRSG